MSMWVFVLLAAGCTAAHHSEFHQSAALPFQPEPHHALAYAAPVHMYSAHSTPVSAAAPAIYTAPHVYAPIAPAPQHALNNVDIYSYSVQSPSAHIYSPHYSAPAAYSTLQYKQPVKTYSQTSYTSPSSINTYSAVSKSSYMPPVMSYSTPQYSAVKYNSPTVQYHAPTVKYQAPSVKYQAPIVKYQAPTVKYQAPSVNYQPSAINQYASSANYKPVAILRHSQDDNFDGSFNYAFEAENGITSSASGYVKQLTPKEQAQVMQGAYSYTAPDGTPVVTRWFADETGFHAEGSHLPVAPPVPEAIAKSLAYQGIAY